MRLRVPSLPIGPRLRKGGVLASEGNMEPPDQDQVKRGLAVYIPTSGAGWDGPIEEEEVYTRDNWL